VLLVPSAARAEVDIAIPDGWSDAAPGSAAARRAEAWAVDGATVQHVLQTTIADDFAETLAVIAVPRALDPGELSDPARAEARLTQAGATLIDADGPPSEVRLVAVDNGATALVGRWEDDTLAMHVALVPEGATHAAIVLAVPRRMDVLYAGVIDDALASLEGAAPPVRAFARGRWLAIAWIAWLVAAIAGAVLLVRSLRDGSGPREVARRIAVIAAAAAMVVAIVGVIATAGADAELAAAGTSAMSLVVQLASGGLVIAAVVLGIAAVLDRRARPIQSAPGEGTYGAWTRVPSGPRPIVPVAVSTSSSSGPIAVAPMPIPIPPPAPAPAPELEGFPAPGRALRLAAPDEPIAHLEHVHDPSDDDDDELASLTTAEIRLDGDGSRPGNRFRSR
jgi:hypothetical protein